jgi:hypothetical protein
MSKSRTSSRSGFGRRADRTGSVETFIRPERSLIVLALAVLRHLRTELAVTVAAAWARLWLTDRMPSWAALTVGLVTGAALMGWGHQQPDSLSDVRRAHPQAPARSRGGSSPATAPGTTAAGAG